MPVPDFVTPPAHVIQYVAPAPLSSICGLTNSQFSCGLVIPQFSTFAAEASASQVVGLFPAVNESVSPVFEQVYQEQIGADPGSFERTQQRTVENIVHVPIPQIQVQFMEGVKQIYDECVSERGLKS